ncbi:hypothetical protein NDU88_002289 [Pleurodeles waltl]|uniref:Uncharacterized protein n=1 Tax=Pleurodeles waltl TaxID=8319 RepID=A0AAV7VAT7_PLEWA|nr:hypothetical protein NDU88_002289 [Pleurodeles waltl]
MSTSGCLLDIRPPPGPSGVSGLPRGSPAAQPCSVPARSPHKLWHSGLLQRPGSTTAEPPHRQARCGPPASSSSQASQPQDSPPGSTAAKSAEVSPPALGCYRQQQQRLSSSEKRSSAKDYVRIIRWPAEHRYSAAILRLGKLRPHQGRDYRNSPLADNYSNAM